MKKMSDKKSLKTRVGKRLLIEVHRITPDATTGQTPSQRTMKKKQLLQNQISHQNDL